MAKSIFSSIACLLIALGLIACSDSDNAPADTTTDTQSKVIALDVYKSPTCGCCVDWIAHMDERGFSSDTHHPADMNRVKQEHQIAPRYQSCHTAVSESGYVFEGHVPAKTVQRFLDNPPEDAIGLAVPGMPLGSPGMEVDDRFMPYQVLLLKTDGSASVYAEFATAGEQY